MHGLRDPKEMSRDQVLLEAAALSAKRELLREKDEVPSHRDSDRLWALENDLQRRTKRDRFRIAAAISFVLSLLIYVYAWQPITGGKLHEPTWNWDLILLAPLIAFGIFMTVTPLFDESALSRQPPAWWRVAVGSVALPLLMLVVWAVGFRADHRLYSESLAVWNRYTAGFAETLKAVQEPWILGHHEQSIAYCAERLTEADVTFCAEMDMSRPEGSEIYNTGDYDEAEFEGKYLDWNPESLDAPY